LIAGWWVGLASTGTLADQHGERARARLGLGGALGVRRLDRNLARCQTSIRMTRFLQLS
jgi:hypothetical protein